MYTYFAFDIADYTWFELYVKIINIFVRLSTLFPPKLKAGLPTWVKIVQPATTVASTLDTCVRARTWTGYIESDEVQIMRVTNVTYYVNMWFYGRAAWSVH